MERSEEALVVGLPTGAEGGVVEEGRGAAIVAAVGGASELTVCSGMLGGGGCRVKPALTC